jgi:hypothetical protein
MKKFLSLAAAALAVGLVMAPQDASARPFGGGFRMGGFHHGGFRGFHGGFRGFHGGFRPAAFHRGFHGGFRPTAFHGGFRPAAFHGGFRHGFRPVAFGRPFVFHRHRRFFPVGALATGALIGAAAASSYYPYYYPASYGFYDDCYQTLQWVPTPYGWRRAWVSTC